MFSALFALALLWPGEPPADEMLSGKSHSGIFVMSFEISLFESCDSDERWWLGAPGDVGTSFRERVNELQAENDSMSPEESSSGSAPLFLTASGRVSTIGGHGHLGQYHRQFNVESFTELRFATLEELNRCITSGFLPLLPKETVGKSADN